jgi:ribonuclease HII
MLQAVKSVSVKPDVLLIDAVKLNSEITVCPIIKGDGLSYSIAAASILAKVYRDKLMAKYAEQYPEYGFEKHKGYGTPEHIAALKALGATPIHRKTFIRNFIGEDNE